MDQTISIAGATTYWTLAAWTDQAKLASLLEAIGWGKAAPPLRRPIAVLRASLEDYAARQKGTFLVRPTSDKQGFVIVKEIKGQEANHYEHTLLSKIINGVPRVMPQADEAEILDLFKRHESLISGTEVATALTRILHQLQAVTLRHSGGFYWLPKDTLGEWLHVADAVSAAAVHGTSTIYRMRTAIDTDVAVALKDAIEAEVLGTAASIFNEINSCDLGNRALETRKGQALDLRQKIKVYEEVLGASLGHLHQAIDKAEVAAASAAMQLAATPAAPAA